MGRNTKRKPARFGFFLYVITMLWLLFGQRMEPGVSIGGLSGEFASNLNLTPFKTILWFVRLPEITDDPYLLTHAFINLVGNVVLFVPLGYMLPDNLPRVNRFWKMLLLVTAVMIAVEILQLFTGLGSCDIDDVILNLFGAVIGYILWRIKTK